MVAAVPERPWKFHLCSHDAYTRPDKIVVYAGTPEELRDLIPRLREIVERHPTHGLSHAATPFELGLEEEPLEGLYVGLDPNFLAGVSWRYYRCIVSAWAELNADYLDELPRGGRARWLERMNLDAGHDGPATLEPSAEDAAYTHRYWKLISDVSLRDPSDEDERSRNLPVATWSRGRRPGLASSWAGNAWTWLQLRRAGLVASPRAEEAILRRLQADLRRDERTYLGTVEHHHSGLVGTAAGALIASASADSRARALLPALVRRWEQDISASTAAPSGDFLASHDVMLGAAGGLLAAAEVDARVPGAVAEHTVARLHERTLEGLAYMLEGSGRRPVYLGFAHGVAGQLFAAETGRACFGRRVPEELRERAFDLLVDEAREGDKGAALWACRSGQAGHVTIHGWCHGAAGIALALLGSYRLTGDDDYAWLAKKALAGAATDIGRCTSFCCGAVGRAHALLEGHRVFGGRKWLRAAKEIYAHAPARFERSRTFHRGPLALDYLGWRIEHPSALPLLGLGALSVQPTTSSEGGAR
jgi:hypothetical protein